MQVINVINAVLPFASCYSCFVFFSSFLTLYTVPKAESNFLRCNYQNHNRKEIVPAFLYLATKETFPSVPNATLPRKKYFFIITSPALNCAHCWDRIQIVRVSAEDASTEPQEQLNLAIKTKRTIKILP